MLVLTRRVAHVEALVALLAEHGHQALVLQGGMPAKERRAVIDKLSEVKGGDGVLVVGTTPFIGEGFDASALDTLFLAAPVSFDGLLVQCAGRVIRSFPDRDVAEVHDYHDAQTPILAVSLQRRMPGYGSWYSSVDTRPYKANRTPPPARSRPHDRRGER